MHGSVGLGKSLIMDLFYNACDGSVRSERPGCYGGDEDEYIKQRRPGLGPTTTRRRCHFHEFMLNDHARMHAIKVRRPRCNPVPPVALSLAREARLLCFDEMQVTDVADAMILRRQFGILLDLGVTVIVTSNRPPEGLYE